MLHFAAYVLARIEFDFAGTAEEAKEYLNEHGAMPETLSRAEVLQVQTCAEYTAEMAAEEDEANNG